MPYDPDKEDMLNLPGGFMKPITAANGIERKIYLIRGQRVMLDSDLAELYGVEVKQLKRQVKRNIDRFPADFMLQLSKDEYASLRRHIGTLKRGEHSKYLPYVFTEQGVDMLSSVLNGKRAVQVNIQIMRVFVKLREMIASHKDLAKRLDEREGKYDAQFAVVFDAIRELMIPPDEDKRKIGFLAKESRARYEKQQVGDKTTSMAAKDDVLVVKKNAKKSILSLGGTAKGRKAGVGNEREYTKKMVARRIAKEGV